MTVYPELLKKVYFLGIGGIGMSALARYLKSSNVDIYGYDKCPTPLTDQLEKEGMIIHFTDDPNLITTDIDLVVYTPAIPSDLKEYNRIKELNLPLLKRSQLLEIITKKFITLAVAGTHGKTTVSTMLAHILHSSPEGCTAFLGGIAKNYNSNLLLDPTSKYMVAEADEFDRSFLKLFPWLAIITSTDADHLDIYHSHDNLLESFSEFTNNISENGVLLIKDGITLQTNNKIRTYTYSVSKNADFSINNLRLYNGNYSFDLVTPTGVITNIKPGLAGYFNVENSLAAASAAWLSGVEPFIIKSSINSFIGVKRRFDYRIVTHDLVYIDDYAHHPEELKACITSVKKIYPGRVITGVFQPHLYTRTRDFAEGFAESLSLLDQLILLEIYPAREKPIEGITSKMLLDLVSIDRKFIMTRDEVIDYLQDNKPDILLTLGAGDIDQLVPRIEEIFS